MPPDSRRGISQELPPSKRPCGPVLLLLTALAGCASTPDDEPVLYPNRHLQQVGRAAAEQDIGECRQLARGHGMRERRDGEVARKTPGVAVQGTTPSGEISPEYRNVVQSCLRERGYEIIGWQ